MTIVGVTVGLIALVADMILRTMQWGSFSSAQQQQRQEGHGGGGILIIVLIVVAIIAPLAAKAVQMAVSRQREYLADATSVQFTRNPNGLISALQQARRGGRALSRSEPCHAASLHRQSDADLHRQVLGAHGHASRHRGPHRSPAQSGRLALASRRGLRPAGAIAAARGLAPENTLAAFRNAVALGVTTLETDLADHQGRRRRC